jgi:hypothetical protein
MRRQTAISEVLRAIASSSHDLHPVFDAILDTTTYLCRADISCLHLSKESGLRCVAVRRNPLLVSQAPGSINLVVIGSIAVPASIAALSSANPKRGA